MMPVLKAYTDYLFSQDILVLFCKHFEKNISSPIELLRHHKTFITQHPELTHFVYQRALEITYEKKRFSNTDLEREFEHRFGIIDMYGGLNNGLSDMTTFNSLFVLNHMREKYNLFEKQQVNVISTPLEYGTERYYNIQSKGATKTYVMLSKLTTGNTNAEIQIGPKLYDIKNTEHTTTCLNHICTWTYERVEREYALHLKCLYDYLVTHSQMPFFIRQQLITRLNELITNKRMNIHDKNLFWNKYLSSKFHQIPEQYGIPLIIEMTSYPHVITTPKKITEKVHISPDVLDNKEKTIKAITGVTILLGQRYNENAHLMSDGIIPLITPEETLD